MSCNCKNKIALEEQYGTPIEVGPIEKFFNFLLKVFVFLIVVFMTLVLTPIIFIVAIYKMFFGKDKGIMIPKKVLDALKAV